MRQSMFLIFCVCALGCDSAAKANDTSAAATPAKPSTEYETCSSSADCDGELRCLQGTCVSQQVSVKGDYYLATGLRALSAGHVEQSIQALRTGVAEYKASKLDPPPELECALGRALSENRHDPTHAEEAAARLHRCVLGSPPRSALRKQALSSLAVLDEVGLDPTHLAADSAAARYLTNAPKKPPTENLSLSVTTSAKVRGRSFTKFVALLKQADIKDKLAPCWEQHWKQSRKATLTVTLPFKFSYRLDENDDFGRSTLEVGEAGSGDAEAAACAKRVLAPVADEYARKAGSESRWNAEFVFTLSAKP